MNTTHSLFTEIDTTCERRISTQVTPAQVRLKDGFWYNYQKLFLCTTVLHAVKSSDVPAYRGNIVNAARKNRGEPHGGFTGWSANDSFAYEAVEGMALALSIDADGDTDVLAAQQEIRKTLSAWLPDFVDCMREDGYLGTYWILEASDTPELYDFASGHELYNMGTYYEAAIAVHKAIGDDSMLRAAMKNVDFVISRIGEGEDKIRAVPGHPEIEEAMLRLADYCDEIGFDEANGMDYPAYAVKCRKMVEWFLENRGQDRDWYGTNQSNYTAAAKPLTELTAADLTGQHTDRAAYLYEAMADWGALTGNTKYDGVLRELYNGVVSSRSYINGAGGVYESWTAANKLDNSLTHCNETCSAMTLIYWAQSMHRLFGDAGYYDTVEQALYNATLSQMDLDGDAFTYYQLMQSEGLTREAWVSCPCCALNLLRIFGKLGGCLYTTEANALNVNLYADSEAKVTVGGTEVALQMKTDMPYDGNAELTISPAVSGSFALRLRLPNWAQGEYSVEVNGVCVNVAPDEKGYLTVNRVWQQGDSVRVRFGMEIFRIYTPEIETNEGLVAIQRGPVLYCAEALDNQNEKLRYVYIPAEAEITLNAKNTLGDGLGAYGTDSLRTLTVAAKHITVNGSEDFTLTMVPYYAWANRGESEMRIFISEAEPELDAYDTGRADASLVGNAAYSKISYLNDGICAPDNYWCSWLSSSVAKEPWVELTFAGEVRICGSSIYWMDDGGLTQVPDSITFQYWDGAKYADIQTFDNFIGNSPAWGVSSYTPTVYNFPQVTTAKLRIQIHNSVKNCAVGIFDWSVLRVSKSVMNMERLSSDLFAAGKASSSFPANVGAVRADGKGFDGSAALGYVYKNIDGDNYWGNSITVKLDASQGFDSDWREATQLWFWMDTTEFTDRVQLDLWLNDLKPLTGTPFYLWEGENCCQGGSLVEAWDGAGYGRIRLPRGYQGFVGIPLSAYKGLDKGSVSQFYFYFECSSDSEALPKTLYFDEFWVTGDGQVPNLTVTPKQSEPYRRILWDMEQLPADVDAGGSITTWNPHLGQYVDASRESGKGYDGSTALGYQLVADAVNPGGDVLQINNPSGLGAAKDFSGADLLWLWVDASEVSTPLRFDLILNWTHPNKGGTYYLWNGKGKVQIKTLEASWDGQPHGRFDLPSRFRGWLGVHLEQYYSYDDDGKPTGFLNAADISNIVLFHGITPNASELPAVIYLDNFILTDRSSLPCAPEVTEEVNRPLWTMEELPENLADLCRSWNTYGTCIEAVRAAQKGYNGTTALGYRYINDTVNPANDVLQMDNIQLLNASGDFSGGDILWFWLDASEFRIGLRLDLLLNWFRPATGSTVLFWDGSNVPTEGVLTPAWSGQPYGRIDVPVGYVGWVGLYLADFCNYDSAYPLNTACIESMILYFGAVPDQKELPAALYLDNFWLTSAGCTPKCPHKAITDCGYSATCTETGLGDGTHCTICNAVLAAQTEIAPLGHDYAANDEDSRAPTCVDDGVSAVKCTRCGDVQTEPIEALGHNYIDGVCSRCGAEDPDYEPTDPCEGYTDIDRSSWYHSAADFVIERGLMGSTKTDKLTFEPNTRVSRAMVASILYTMAGKPEADYKGTFSDVPAGKWFTVAIEWCAQNGLASGKGNGKFDPDGNVTRQELAVFMMQMAAYLEKDTSGRNDLTGFADAQKVPAWAKTYVQWAVDAGLISGKASGDKTYLASADTATRAELAAIIRSFVQNIAEAE